ncbi:uncharacterized protein [Miscanthus floridulus]|uniref:uncharacterized protein n=1 Tax=Miscanthus floridulus TaxID=154761 RepID=UPI00345ABECA
MDDVHWRAGAGRRGPARGVGRRGRAGAGRRGLARGAGTGGQARDAGGRRTGAGIGGQVRDAERRGLVWAGAGQGGQGAAAWRGAKPGGAAVARAGRAGCTPVCNFPTTSAAAAPSANTPFGCPCFGCSHLLLLPANQQPQASSSHPSSSCISRFE